MLVHLKHLLDHVMYYNRLGPFPYYGSDYEEDIKNKIKEMEENSKYDYDKDPVVACMYCGSLHIIIDELDNNHCARCGSKNDLEHFDNIYEYQKKVTKLRY